MTEKIQLGELEYHQKLKDGEIIVHNIDPDTMRTRVFYNNKLYDVTYSFDTMLFTLVRI